MPYPKVKISDDDGNAVGVTSNRLDVNAYLSATPTIDIGDVSIKSGDGTPITDTISGRLDVTLDSNSGVHAEDDAHSNTDKGIMTLAVRNDLLASLAGTDGDYAPLQVTATGSLYVNISDSLVAPGVSYSAQRGIVSIGLRNDVLEALFNIDDGEYSAFQINALGALYVTGGEVENAAVQSEPLLIGGRFDSSARTLGNGDAGAVALNASGHVLMDVVDGGQLDTIIDTLETTLTAIETDQAAIEALLITIDTDTDAIKTAVQLIDNAIDGSEMQVDIVSAPTLTVDGSGVTQPVSGTVTANLSATDNAVLDAMVVDLAAMEALLGTIDADTNGIKIYLSNLSGTQYTDDGDWTDNNSKHLLVGGLYQSSMQSVTDGDVAPFQVDANGVLRTSHSITGLQSDDNDTVGTSAEKISGADGDVACKRVDIMAHPSNTGYIWVGDSAVSVDGLNGGIRLSPGDFYSMDIDNTGDVYAIATVNGENVCFNYFT